MRWDWENNGVWDTEFSTTKTRHHQYAAAGTATIRVEVKDSDGLTAQATHSVTVGDYLVQTSPENVLANLLIAYEHRIDGKPAWYIFRWEDQPIGGKKAEVLSWGSLKAMYR